MAIKYKVRSAPRSSNVAETYNNKKMVSADGNRSATARNQKCAGPNRTYTIVECWTLRERNENGRMVVVSSQRSEDDARAFVTTA